MDAVYEIVLFRLKPDVEREHYLQVAANATDWLRARPGFLSRDILEDESGQWVELLRWQSMADALSAAAAMEGTPEAAAIYDVVAPESICMLHLRPVATYAIAGTD
jgi:antibiotic biosynthesis monooxygenase (ABM) superfamily enzyme